MLVPESEFFWTSGSEGVLRFRRCADCRSFQHPPGPICRTCGSSNLAPEDVSGRGVLVGFTVNEHMWIPSMPPPYVIGIVAIDEDPRVRLTTNIIDVPVEELAVGRRVEVRFQQAEDVWLPLFTYAADDPSEGPVPEDEPPEPWVRPMVSPDKFEDKVAITGIGMSRLGRRLGVDPLSLTIEAARNAVADAGLTMADIDGLSTYPGGFAAGGHSEGGVTALEESLRIRPTWFNGTGETAGPGWFGRGRHVGRGRRTLSPRAVLPHRVGVDMGGTPAQPPAVGRVQGRGRFHAVARAVRRHERRQLDCHERVQPLLPLRHHPRRAGAIATNARRNAGLNPVAIYRDPMTMDDYFAARMITSPFGLFDCDVPCDGSIALMVSAADVAPDLARPPVYVEAVGTQIIDRVSWDQGTLSHEPQTQGPAAHLWSRTSLRPEDVDFAQLYDGFTFNCLSWLEGLGFCGIGEAGDFLSDPGRIALGRPVAPEHLRRAALRRAYARVRLSPRGGRPAAR